MPRALERRLRATARRRGYSRKRTSAYVYGTMNRIAARHKARRRAR